jgi:perosamine synthetase
MRWNARSRTCATRLGSGSSDGREDTRVARSLSVGTKGKEPALGAPRVAWKGEPDLGGWYTEEELAAVEEAMRDASDWRRHFRPERIERFEDAFARYVGTRYAVSTNSGGTGLDIALACIDAAQGDEVISCALNFPGTHLSVIGRGLRLVLCEPDPRTLNADPYDVAERIGPRTRAILVTHMNGLAADMEALEDVVAEAGRRWGRTPVIVCDAARACGARGPTGRVGKSGLLTVFSFQRKKLLSTLGEGGMVTTDSEAAARRARRLRAFGDGEEWGSNYKLTEVQAAVGLVQLARLNRMNDERIARAEERTQLLRGSLAAPVIILPEAPPGYRHVYYLYTLLLRSGLRTGLRELLVALLRRRFGVGCAIANPPTYLRSRLIREHIADQRPLPVAEDVGSRVFCPSLHPKMTGEENRYVVEALCEALVELAAA